MAADLISRIRAIQGEIAETGPRDGDYEVAYTTLHVGKIQGGEVMNIVPNRCSFDSEIRYLPEDDADGIVSRLKAAAEQVASVSAASSRKRASISPSCRATRHEHAGRLRGREVRAYR